VQEFLWILILIFLSAFFCGHVVRIDRGGTETGETPARAENFSEGNIGTGKEPRAFELMVDDKPNMLFTI
jgi:hypothetical protein